MAVESQNHSMNICNGLKLKTKIMHLLLTDYINELDKNIGSNVVDSIKSLLSSFGKDEYSIDLADAYNRLGVYNSKAGNYLEAVKAFQQEENIRLHMAPDEYNSVYVNILKSYSSLLNSSTISPDMEGLIQNYQDINGGGEPAIKLLVDINSKKFDLKLYDQAKACLNKAVDV